MIPQTKNVALKGISSIVGSDVTMVTRSPYY
jgi:hypothetical protein